MWPLDLVDRIASLPFKETRDLPPNRFRIRVGCGDRVLFNQIHFRLMAVDFWLHAFANGLLQIDSNILDIGCGCGRFAIVLKRLNHKGWKFSGTYTGIDTDREMIEWCQQHFPARHFRFIWADRYSKVYNPAGTRESSYRLPLESCGQDFVFSTSLFTHLLDDELTNYLSESYRVLRPGRKMCMSVFCLDHLTDGARRGRSFDHRIGPAYVADPDRPEAAVAYRQDHLLNRCREAGFHSAEVGPHGGQHTLVAAK